MFALRGGDDVLVLGTEGLCLCAAPAVTVEIFQASSWICSFPLPAATRARTAEHRTLLWKRKKKKNPTEICLLSRKNGFTALRTWPCFSNTAPKQWSDAHIRSQACIG